MLLKQVMELFDVLDRPDASGEKIAELFRSKGAKLVEVNTLSQGEGATDAVKIVIPGKNGKLSGGTAPTMGVIGRLGGLGARPEVTGFVSDGDGALAALTVALKLTEMQSYGDQLEGDVIVCTHVDPDAPTSEHYPVPFMGSCIDMELMNQYEVDSRMEAILSIDTTKGNKIFNHRGFSITPTIKEGYVLKVSEDLADIMATTTGELAKVFPVSIQDITPYGNDVYHVNSILQPATSTSAPVVGVAITTQSSVAGCATGASHPVDVEEAARFALEAAKMYTSGKCHFYDEKEYDHLLSLYGDLKRFQTLGGK